MTVHNGYALVPVNELAPCGYNPNELTGEQFAQLVDELRHQGAALKPVVARQVDGKLIIVDGEHTWRAAQRAGLATVPVEVIAVDDFEARRQTFVRNKHGDVHKVRLGRMIREMLAARGLSNRELAPELGVKEGTVRNMLLYAKLADLLAERGDEDADERVHRMGVRQVREMLERLEGDGADEGEAGAADAPGPAEAEARILARLKRAWDKATGDERSAFLMWASVGADVQVAYDRGFVDGQAKAARAAAAVHREGYEEGFAAAARNAGLAVAMLEAGEVGAAVPAPAEPRNGYAPEAPAPNGEATADEIAATRATAAAASTPAPNGHAADLAARITAARTARGWSQKRLAEAAGTNPPVVSDIERGKLTGGKRVARVLDALGMTA